MARATLAKLNEYIGREFPGLNIELVKGYGYFYFAGADGTRLQVESIYVYALHQMSRSAWQALIHQQIDEALDRWATRHGETYTPEKKL